MLATSSGSTTYVVVVLALYFLPTLVAAGRKATNAGSVFLINLLTGWSIIGWFVALGLAGSGNATRRDRYCPACGVPPNRGVTVCRKCGHDFAAASGAGAVAPVTPPKWSVGDPFA